MTKELVIKAGKDMIYLASCALHGRIPEQSELAEMNLKQVYSMAKFHSLQSIVYICLAKCVKEYGKEVVSDEVYHRFAADYQLTMRRLVMFDMERPYDFPEMDFPERKRHTAVVERICNAVSKSTDDEERNRKKKRKIILLTRKTHSSCHHYTAADSKESATESACAQTKFKNLLSSTLNIHWADARKQRRAKTANDISKENHSQHSRLTFHNEASCSCIEFEFISNDCQKSEAEEHSSEK